MTNEHSYLTGHQQPLPPLRAFHGDPAFKAALLAEIGKHEAADAIIQGSYGEMHLGLAEGFRGCAIGCALHSLNALDLKWCPTPGPTHSHERFPLELGLPIWLAHLIDHVFERLPKAYGVTWPRRVIEAITPGIDCSDVVPALSKWMADCFMADCFTPEEKAEAEKAHVLLAEQIIYYLRRVKP